MAAKCRAEENSAIGYSYQAQTTVFYKFGGLLVQQSTNGLFEIYLEKFQTVYKPNQEFFLDETMILWRSWLHIWTYNPRKIIKHVYFLLWSLKAPQALPGIWKYASEKKKKKLQETIFTVLEFYVDQNYQVYQDSY